MSKYNATTGEMDFGLALDGIKRGSKLSRSGWNGKGMFVFLVEPEHVGVLPYIAMRTAEQHFVPWIASQTDMLAEDWVEVL